MRTIYNAHERELAAPAAAAGALLDRIASARDPLWPAPAWVPIQLDRALGVGATGGHGPIRYSVSEYEPGRRVRFQFDPSIGFAGYHELAVTAAGPARCVMRHVLAGEARGWMWPLWHLAIRSLHDAVLEDLLDNAELAATGRPPARPARWSRWVRLLRATEFPRPHAVRIPDAARLARAAFGGVDDLALADAWQLPLYPGISRDPRGWAAALFGHSRTFAVVAADGAEVLLGSDRRLFDFRASVLVDDGAVTVTSVARARNAFGRLYLAAVRRGHPLAVRTILRRAVRRLAEQAPSAAERANARLVAP